MQHFHIVFLHLAFLGDDHFHLLFRQNAHKHLAARGLGLGGIILGRAGLVAPASASAGGRFPLLNVLVVQIVVVTKIFGKSFVVPEGGVNGRDIVRIRLFRRAGRQSGLFAAPASARTAAALFLAGRAFLGSAFLGRLRAVSTRQDGKKILGRDVAKGSREIRRSNRSGGLSRKRRLLPGKPGRGKGRSGFLQRISAFGQGIRRNRFGNSRRRAFSARAA